MSRTKRSFLGYTAHSEAAALTQDEIDREIEALYQRIQILRLTRNALAPINRLPPELLTRIFSLIQGGWSTESPVKKSLPRDFMKWSAVTHVSQYWRDVALECAGLWSTIPLRHEGYLDAALSHSKCSPLSLELGDIHDGQLPLVEKALRHLDRVRHLHIAPSRWSTYAVFLLAKPALSLESFSIGPHHSLGLPRDLFAGFAPQLKSLALSGCGFDWTNLVFSNLTTMTIIRPDSRVLPGTLVGILEAMPLLTEITLEDALSGALEPISQMKPHRLHELDRLVIRDVAFKAVLKLLSLITFSKTVHFHFTTSGDQEVGEEGFPKILRAYLDASDNAKDITIRSLIFGCGSTFCYDSWTSFYHENEDSILSLRFGGLGSYEHLSEDWLRASLMFPHHKVQSIRVLANIPEETWSAFLPSFPRLFHLRALGAGGRTFLNWFVHNLSSQDGERVTPHLDTPIPMSSSPSTAVLTEKQGSPPKSPSSLPPSPDVNPVLEYISLYDVNFKDMDFESMRAAFSRRRQKQEGRGKKLKLILSRCPSLSAPEVDAIRSAVTDVRWDGFLEE
ncbi:hypothetical protein BDN72DRAFT_841523 [Pluteus cervinus]|uniref:Uncharacterized protein n=1 Tax=Pluteus cervinus TaxID=181527 RepID=A0ACD3ATG7_9AGAR|nr:hypothetical protein BDN72DRAFT_841523 [Pluteus cervinus]